MTDFTIIDYLYIAITIGSTIWAFSRGGVYELVATFSWLVAALTSRFVSPGLNQFFQELFGLSEPTIGTLVASYFIVFFTVLVVFGFFNQRLRDWVQGSILQITDRTLGVIFGILRAIVVMGLLYWTLLWYYEDATKPTYLIDARSRPMMQLAAIKLNEWFVGDKSNLLEQDKERSYEAEELYKNLIDPAIKAAAKQPESNGTSSSAPAPDEDTGYKASERDALDNQLMQLEQLPLEN